MIVLRFVECERISCLAFLFSKKKFKTFKTRTEKQEITRRHALIESHHDMNISRNQKRLSI